MPTPAVPAFSAQTESGQNYPALAGVWTPQGLSGATLLPGGHASGKVYFDAVGEPPTSVVYNGAGDMLTWIEPPIAPPAEVAPEEAASDEGAPVAKSLRRLPNRKVRTAPAWTRGQQRRSPAEEG